MFTQVLRVFYQHPRRCHHRGSSWSKTNCTRAVCISHFALNLRINSSAEWMIWNDMKWYEMIWNDMKWYEMKEIIVRTYPKMSQVYDVTLCDTLRWEMCRRRDWISRCCKLWSGCIGCGVEIGKFAVQFDMKRWSICWTERVPRESKRGIAGIASCAQYFTVLPLLRRGQWEVWWRSCRGPSIRFHDDRL